MTGIQFVTDDKGRKTAVLIDLKKHKAIWEDFWDGPHFRIPPQTKGHSL
jgi:hypothetical protein